MFLPIRASGVMTIGKDGSIEALDVFRCHWNALVTKHLVDPKNRDTFLPDTFAWMALGEYFVDLSNDLKTFRPAPGMYDLIFCHPDHTPPVGKGYYIYNKPPLKGCLVLAPTGFKLPVEWPFHVHREAPNKNTTPIPIIGVMESLYNAFLDEAREAITFVSLFSEFNPLKYFYKWRAKRVLAKAEKMNTLHKLGKVGHLNIRSLHDKLLK